MLESSNLQVCFACVTELNIHFNINKAGRVFDFSSTLLLHKLSFDSLFETILFLNIFKFSGKGFPKLQEQLATAQNELERRSEEIIQLKGVLANQTNDMKFMLNSKTRTGTFEIIFCFYLFLPVLPFCFLC